MEEKNIELRNDGTKIYFPNLSNIHPEAKIGAGCTIHAPVWIGKDVAIGKRVKIQAFVFIPDGVTIEDDCFVGPHVCFTNDKYPPSHGRGWATTLVKKGASIGALSVILPGVTIGEFSKVGAASVVTKDVPSGVIVMGNPAHIYVKKTDTHGEIS